MANYDAIADVSESVLTLLRESITARSDVVSVDRSDIALASPTDVTSESDVRLGLYLYDLSQNSTLSNADRRTVDTNTRRDPPLALDVRYLLTAYPHGTDDGDTTSETLSQQRLLGLAMQVLYDNAVLDADQLQGSLGETDLKISLESASLDQLTGLWSTFADTPYQPSASYHVRPVLIDSQHEEEIARVSEQQTGVSRKPENSSFGSKKERERR